MRTWCKQAAKAMDKCEGLVSSPYGEALKRWVKESKKPRPYWWLAGKKRILFHGKKEIMAATGWDGDGMKTSRTTAG